MPEQAPFSLVFTRHKCHSYLVFLTVVSKAVGEAQQSDPSQALKREFGSFVKYQCPYLGQDQQLDPNWGVFGRCVPAAVHPQPVSPAAVSLDQRNSPLSQSCPVEILASCCSWCFLNHFLSPVCASQAGEMNSIHDTRGALCCLLPLPPQLQRDSLQNLIPHDLP